MRKMRRFSIYDLSLVSLVSAFLLTFLLVPIGYVLLESLRVGQSFSLDSYAEFFSSSFYLEASLNSIIWATLTTAAASIIGLPLAYILSRYDIPAKGTFRFLLTLPLITPPFVGAMALLNLFGSYGTLNVILSDWLHLTSEPINFIFGLHGLVLVETLHLFPLIVLNTDFSSINKEYEELAEISGASGRSRFFRVTMPLVAPSFANGAFLVFIFTFVDFATPMVLRETKYLATEAVNAIVLSFLDVRRYRLGLVGTVVMTIFTIACLVFMRSLIERRRYHLKGPARIITASGLKKGIMMGYALLIAGLGLMVPTWIILSAFSKSWSFTAFPTTWTVDNFKLIVLDTPLYIKNSLAFALIALAINILVGLAVAYILTRIEIPGKHFLDSLTTFILAVPGIIMGVGYLLLFSQPVMGFSLARTWVVMPLVIAVRRLPYMIRPAYGAFLGLERSLEDVASVFGARRYSILAKITLPLTKRLVFAGALFTFINAVQELSSTIFLYRPGWETMTIGIFILFLSSGFFEAAAALGVILIIVVSICIILAYRLTEKGMQYGIA